MVSGEPVPFDPQFIAGVLAELLGEERGAVVTATVIPGAAEDRQECAREEGGRWTGGR